MSFQWQKARAVLSTSVHKSAPSWPDAFLPEDLAALQFPEGIDQKALLRCIRAAVQSGEVQTVSITARRNCLPGWRELPSDSDLRAILRNISSSLEEIAASAVSRKAFADFLAEQKLEPSAHVRAWLGELPTPAGVGQIASEPKRGERQVLAILEEAKKLSIDPLAIPRGGKRKLKEICLLRTELFTDSGFDHAWKNAIAEDPPRLRVTNHDIYARK